MKNIIIQVLEYLTHKSTWAGIVVALGTVGVQTVGGIDLGVIAEGAAMIVSGVLVFVAERNKDNTDKVEELLK